MKNIVISKAFIESYWNNFIEKAMSHKYIRKIPNSKGGFYYIYAKDFARPMKVLLSVFGLKEEKISNAYEKNNIQEAYGVNKQGFAAHLLEYLSNRATWNKFFSDKFNRERFKIPENKQTTNEGKTAVKNSEIKNNGKTTDNSGKEHNKDGEVKTKWNNSLMRKIYSMYNKIPEDSKIENQNNGGALSVGDMVSYNGRVGKITKDFQNGLYFVNFEDGGMGRLNASELLNMNQTSQEATIQADENGKEIKENDPTLNTTNDTVAEVTSNYEDEVIKEKERYREKVAVMDENEKKALKEKFESALVNGEYNEYAAKIVQARIDVLNDSLSVVSVNQPVEEKTKEQKEKEWHEKWDVRLADEFVKGKEKYLNAKPLVSNNAFILFNKIWDQIKDKTKNEQIKALYNMVKDDHQMSWNESLAYRKEGYSKEEVRFGYINAFLETKNSADKYDLDIEYNKTKENYTSLDMGIRNIYARQRTYNLSDEQVSQEKIEYWKNEIENGNRGFEQMKSKGLSVNETLHNLKNKVLTDLINEETNKLAEHENRSQAMMGNQNARKYGLTEDEADALEYYVQDAGYTYINDKLRGTDETPMEQNHIDAIKNIDNVISRNTVKEKTLYRGIGGNTIFPTMNPYEHRLMELYLSNKSAYDSMSNDEWFEVTKYTGAKDNVEKYLKDIIGKTFNDKGYVSTSKDIKQTKTFSDSYKNGITIEFQNIPENTHGVDLSEFDGARELRAENEVLLHRDLNYKITGAKSVDGKIVLTAEIIPESDAEKTQNRSEAKMGNGNAKRMFTSFTNEEKRQKKEQIENNIVSSIPKDSVPYNNDGKFGFAAKEWVKNNPQGNARSEIGEVMITPNSADNDLRHGDKKDLYLKLQTFPAIKDILEKGTYLGYERDFDGKNISNHYFAGKINYGGEEKIIFCRVRETDGLSGRFYVHEVFTEDEIKKANQVPEIDVGLPQLTGKPLFEFILRDVLNVNTDTSKLSEVMRNNQNAKGKHNVKPQTESEMKKEQKKEKEACKKAGLPNTGNNVGDRVSAIDDADTWNPNSENYRFKDTGYIAGSRKELASMFIMERAKRGERIDAHELDFDGLEGVSPSEIGRSRQNIRKIFRFRNRNFLIVDNRKVFISMN